MPAPCSADRDGAGEGGWRKTVRTFAHGFAKSVCLVASFFRKHAWRASDTAATEPVEYTSRRAASRNRATGGRKRFRHLRGGDAALLCFCLSGRADTEYCGPPGRPAQRLFLF